MEPEQVYEMANLLWKYPPLILLSLCWLGNCLSFLVMSRPAMRDNSVSVYLRFIAAADIATTTVGLGPRVAQVWAGVIFDNLGAAACKIERFLLFGCGDLAIWCLTVLTVDRLIIVKLPLKAKTWCSKTRAGKVCAVITLLGIGKNLSSLWSRGERWELPDGPTNSTDLVMMAKCGQVPQFDFFENYVRSWLGFSTYFFGPLMVIVVSNTLIVKQLLQSGRFRSSMRDHDRDGKKSADDTNSNMTRMMLLVTLMYVILITPSMSMYISVPYWPAVEPFSSWQIFAFAATDVLVYSNHTMNFVMYVLSGKKFRSELAQLLCLGSGRGSSTNSRLSGTLSRGKSSQYQARTSVSQIRVSSDQV